MGAPELPGLVPAADYLTIMVRPTPYDLVFTDLADERFPAIQAAMDAAGYDHSDRDAFLLLRETVELLRDLRPDDGLGEGIDQLAALLHHAFLYRESGKTVITVDAPALDDLLRPGACTPGASPPGDLSPATYLQLPPGRVWATVVPGEAAEPMDGCFIHPAPTPGVIRTLGVFGVRPDRDGFSVVEAAGARPVALERADGSELFSSTLSGGAAAGLRSLAGPEELLELAWRSLPATNPTPVHAPTGAGQWTV